jgi:integrase/recombinase XerD
MRQESRISGACSAPTRRHTFVASLLDAGRKANTARSRQLSVRRFSAWLAEEREIPADQLVGMKAAKLDTKVYEPLTDDQVKALLATCQGPAMYDRRDEALVRLMVETGARAGEVADMQLSDVNLPAGTVVIRRGNGGKGRSVPIGPQTVRAIDRYIRSRRTHPP